MAEVLCHGQGNENHGRTMHRGEYFLSILMLYLMGVFKKLAILPSGNLGTEDDECVRGTPIFSQTIHYLDY